MTYDDDNPKPTVNWVWRALAPGLVSLGAAVISVLIRPMQGAMVAIQLLAVPVCVVYLIWLSDGYVKSAPGTRSRVGFILGSLALNAMIWFGGCAVTWTQISIH